MTNKGLTLSDNAQKFAAVVVEAPLTTVYHYSIPEKLLSKLVVGARVVAPFGRRKIGGFCVEISDTCPIDKSRLKNISECSPPDEAMPEDLLKLTKWISSYYRSSWGAVLSAAVPAGVRKGKNVRPEYSVEILKSVDDMKVEAALLGKRARRQAEALEVLIESNAPTILAKVVQNKCGCTLDILRSLEKKGFCKVTAIDSIREFKVLHEAHKDITLSDEQQVAVGSLIGALNENKFSTHLLYGVTGSGKTEVYLQVMQQALDMGKSVLVLVPEISLTPQTVGRFRSRAGEVAVLHSNMSAGERAQQWRRLRSGKVRVVVGARSAVFAPLDNLGLIIVDEEHEKTFKQDNDPRYHARDVAVVRAKEAGAVVVLGSATPCMESWQNARDGKYNLLSLTERPGGASPPVCKVVDLKEEWRIQKKQVLISGELDKAIHACLQKKEQAILFLNRRGFSTYVYCSDCGEPVKCAACDISLTFHRGSNILRCHYCSDEMKVPERCTMCDGELYFTGTGTERAEDIISKMFPEARLLRMDSDSMAGRDAHASALSDFAAGEYDILLGTQMVAKGLDFPEVTLVGVLNADSAISMPDFRAAERTFQLITQVCGRAGRAHKHGLAIIQAMQPEHYAVKFATEQDYYAYAEKESNFRKVMSYPPFGKLARIVVRGKNEDRVAGACDNIASIAKEAELKTLRVLGPASCPIGKIQSNYRYHVLLKSRELSDIRTAVARVQGCIVLPNGVKMAVDIDPASLL